MTCKMEHAVEPKRRLALRRRVGTCEPFPRTTFFTFRSQKVPLSSSYGLVCDSAFSVQTFLRLSSISLGPFVVLFPLCPSQRQPNRQMPRIDKSAEAEAAREMVFGSFTCFLRYFDNCNLIIKLFHPIPLYQEGLIRLFSVDWRPSNTLVHQWITIHDSTSHFVDQGAQEMKPVLKRLSKCVDAVL